MTAAIPGRRSPTTPGFCRDCLADVDLTNRCAACGSPRVVRHAEIATLSIAHIDCDAFYATIEKRDDPTLADRPVIVGGGQRGVVSAACYIARTYGVRSAMPMFEARRRCPDAAIIKPKIAKYAKTGRDVRNAMLELTPLVEPLSIDEAFLDLTGTERLHRMSAAKALARFAQRVERDFGITVSVGLSGNKFLAKIASDLDKPRGFAVLSPAEAPGFLAPKPVGFIYGIGAAGAARLGADGFRTIADLQRATASDLIARYGEEGLRLSSLSRGIDSRRVNPERETKSISSETTFMRDISEFRALEQHLWELSEKVSSRLKASGLAGVTITLKLKTADFKIRARSRSLAQPTHLADRIFAEGRAMLENEAGNCRYRLIGIGVSGLEDCDDDAITDFLDRRTGNAEHAVDRLRKRFGADSVVRGLVFDND